MFFKIVKKKLIFLITVKNKILFLSELCFLPHRYTIKYTFTVKGNRLSYKYYAYFIVSCSITFFIFWLLVLILFVKYPFLGLERDLQDHVFGQHFVKHIIPRSLKGHLQNPNPKKALVMSFHGWTGCGKNHVSQIIANNLYKKGTESVYFHLYIGSRDFVHKQEVNKYRVRKIIYLYSKCTSQHCKMLCNLS